MKKYLKSLSEIYKLKNLITEGIIISFIVCFIDIFNLPSLIINNNCMYLLIISILFLITRFIDKKIFNMVIAKNINIFDKLLFNLVLSTLFLFIYVFAFDYKFYKFVTLIIFFFFEIIILIVKIQNNKKALKDLDYNVLDLEYICNKTTELNDKKIVLLEEKDVDYDLLNRKDIINQLYNTIINCNPQKNFTIGLNGNWGSGKTTIINNVLKIINKNKILNNQYIIVKFDPWKYNDEKSTLRAFLTEVLKHTNYNLNINNYDTLIEDVINIVFGEKMSLLSILINNEIKNIKSDIEISKIVNNYLNSNNKKMIIIFDNLDRVDANIAFILIKCIDSIVEFNNTINVLLYDEDILNTLLKEKFHYEKNYMDKLVQLKIDVPEADIYTIKNIKNCIANNLLLNGKPFINFINNEQYIFNNIRELKRFINSVISFKINSSSKLNVEDNYNLEYIKSICPKLYYEIWNNKRFFIYYDRKYDFNIYTLNINELNKNAKEYYEKLFENKEFEKYHSILEKMFPSINNYKNEKEPFEKIISEDLLNESVINNRMCNTRYFDLYFTREENDFIKINDDVAKLIKDINSQYCIKDTFITLFKTYNADEQKVFSEVLNLNIFKILPEKSLSVINILYKCNLSFNNRILFFELDSWQRVNIIIADLLTKISLKEFDKFKASVLSDYKNLNLIYNIKYWIDNNKKKNIVYEFDFDNLYNGMCQKIFDTNINLYSEKYYTKGNIWALYRFNMEKTKKYVLKNVNKNNIYYFLSDLITTSVASSKYGYKFESKDLIELYPDCNIDKLLQEHPQKLKEKEKLIKDTYDFSKTNTDEYNDRIYKDEVIKL